VVGRPLALLVALAAAACTTQVAGLLGTEHLPDAGADSGQPIVDGGTDGGFDSGIDSGTRLDAGANAGSDSGVMPDSGVDAGAPLDPCIGDSDGPLPDGTPCKLWWEPCVDDATCTGGVCDSPTADAEKPGDVRWTYLAEPGWFESFAIDGAGNVYVPAGSYGVFSLDACGTFRWQSPGDLIDSLAISGDQIITRGSNKICSYASANGAQLWCVDLSSFLTSTDGGPAWVDFAISSRGEIQTIIDYDIPMSRPPNGWDKPVGTKLVGIAADGGVLSANDLLPSFVRGGWYRPLVDLSGNVWVSHNDGNQFVDSVESVASYDSDGTLRFALIDAGYVVLIGGGAALGNQAYLLDGGGAIDGTQWLQYTCWSGPPPLVDGAGNVYLASCNGSISKNTVEGEPFWNADLGGSANWIVQSMVLSDPEIFVVMADPSNQEQMGLIWALDTATGNLLWTATFVENTQAQNVAMLSSTGTLIIGGGFLQGVFAGKVHPSTTAYWPTFEGDNEGRYSPPVTAGQ
jgi:hypothetical protein